LRPLLRRATPYAWLAVFSLEFLAALAAAAPPLGWFNASAPPPGWKLLSVPAQQATIAYPPSMRPARRSRDGTYLRG